jgi:hypothetical protein
MKTYRTLTIALAVLAALFAFLWLSGGKKPAVEQANELWHTNTAQLWHTNTVQLWCTNTVDRWRTNTVQVEHTNTVVQTVTNEIAKEVPARLSAQEKQAGTAGFKYLNAPSLAEGSSALFKASPVAVEVLLDDSATKTLTEGPDGVRQAFEAALGSRNIPVAANSPGQLSLSIQQSWATDVPRVALLSFRLELRETVALQRQSDVVKCPAVVWSTKLFKLVRTFNTQEEVKQAVQDAVGRFCDDYAKAKESEKEVESRVPAVPSVFSL